MAAADTVTLDREAVIEAIAWLAAAGCVFNTLNGFCDSDLTDPLDEAASTLTEAFNLPYYDKDPMRVELDARWYDHTADLLDVLLAGNAPLFVDLDEDDRREIAMSARRRRKHAADIRRAGTIDVPYPDVAEVR